MIWSTVQSWFPAGTPFVHGWKEVLFAACETNNPPMVRRALLHGGTTEAFLPSQDGEHDARWHGVSAWGVAIQFGSWKAVEALLAGGANVHEEVPYPYNIAWAGKSGKSWSNRIPLFCLVVARLTGQNENLEEGMYRSVQTMIERFLDAGALGNGRYDLTINEGKRKIPPGQPFRAIDHLIIDHPLLLSRLSTALLLRLDVLDGSITNPLHLLLRHHRDPERLFKGTVALVEAGVSPYTLDDQGYSPLHRLAYKLPPSFFIPLLDRLPHLVLHEHPDSMGHSALDTLRLALSRTSDANVEDQETVERLARMSVEHSKIPLREAIANMDDVLTATPAKVRRRL